MATRIGFDLVAPLAELGTRLMGRVPSSCWVAAWQAYWRIAFVLQRRRVARMETNLAAALGDGVAKAARRRMARASFRHLHRSVLEAALPVLYDGERRRVGRLPVDGLEHLEKAVARGRGVIAVSAHFGAFTLLPIRLGATHAVSLVANRPDHDRTAAWLDDCRARVGLETVPVRPRHAAARASLAALREGRILVIYADEFKTGGVPVEFLGHPASAPRGPATLALRTGAALLPAFAFRGPGDEVRIEIAPEIELARTGDPVEDVRITTARVCDAIESRVRRAPEQWSWLNFRRRARLASPKFGGSKSRGSTS